MELAIVLVVLGLLIGTLGPMLMSLVKRDKLAEGRRTVRAALEETVGYAMVNGAPPASNATWHAAVGHTRDPWQESLYYYPATQYLDSGGAPTSNPCNATATDLNVTFCADAACAGGVTKANVAFVVGSKGENLNQQSANASGVVKIYDYGVQVDDYAGGSDPNDPNAHYDDIVEYTQLYGLVSRICASGNATGSGNGTGPPTGCSGSYTFQIRAQGKDKSYDVNGGGCTNVPKNTSTAQIPIGDADVLTVYDKKNCGGAIHAQGTPVSLDTDGDCNAYVNCTGGSCSSS